MEYQASLEEMAKAYAEETKGEITTPLEAMADDIASGKRKILLKDSRELFGQKQSGYKQEDILNSLHRVNDRRIS